uniref:Uncharacterized protein n=2 Tax=Caenorhabditis tropicalis TaxID=1561998 RepID=A0A1I7UMN9_9PELO
MIYGFNMPPQNEIITTEELMEGIESKPRGPKCRPDVLEYTDSMKRHFPHDHTEFYKEMDIERKTDGRLATVECLDLTFFFFVWPEEIIRNFRKN